MAIAPDLGERYLDTVYRPGWVADAYGSELDAADGSIDLRHEAPEDLAGLSSAPPLLR